MYNIVYMVQTKTLHIATFGPGEEETIIAGIRNFPVHRLILVCYDSDRQNAEAFARKLSSFLGIRVTITVIKRENIIRDMIERVGEIISQEGKEFQQILMNISCGDKLIGCAALSTAFVNGIKTFSIDETGMPVFLPILRLSYNEIISESKMKILRTIDECGGSIESLEQLEQLTGYGKSLLSYHIMGSKDSKGLVELGLLEVEKGNRSKVSARLTTLGKLLIISSKG